MPRPRSTDPERLLPDAREGAESAWREIYGELAPGVLGYLRARGARDPENLTGEVFVQVVRDLNRFQGDWPGFRGWTFTIARNRLLDERRSDSRRSVEPLLDAESELEGSADVEEEVFARFGLGRVVEVLGALSPSQRDVLLLRVLGDLSVEEVARVLGKRQGSIKQLQRRGLASARRKLEPQAAGSGGAGVTESAPAALTRTRWLRPPTMDR